MYSPYERTLHGYEIVEEGIDQEQTAHGYEDADPYTDALVSDESLSKSDGFSGRLAVTRTARHASFSIASGTVYEAAKEEKEFLKNSVNSIKGLDRKLMTHQISSQQWQHRMEESHKISDELVKSKTIHKISSEFITNAKLYGGVIIREKNLPPELKSIQPIDLGGVAGGTKYMCGGILFKFANDVELPSGSWMYGGGAPAEEAAHKAAGHERKALYAIIRAGVEGLHAGIMTLVDFLGYRLSAQSILPIAGSETLVYGSMNAGVEILAGEKHPRLVTSLDELARRLNLAYHKVKELDGTVKSICLPTDIEVHCAKRSGKYYIIDTARLFPPCYPQTSKREIFYRLFRREFLTLYGKPLSSDSLSQFGALEKEQNVNDIKTATVYLMEEHIPKVAREMDAVGSLALAHISQHLQQAGINMRFLGHVRKHITDKEISRRILVEMCCRTLQKHIFRKWREETITGSPSEICVNVLNEAIHGVDSGSEKGGSKQFARLKKNSQDLKRLSQNLKNLKNLSQNLKNVMSSNVGETQSNWLFRETSSKYGRDCVSQDDFPLTQEEKKSLIRQLQNRAGIVVDESFEVTDFFTESDVTLEPRVKKLSEFAVLDAEALRVEAKRVTGTRALLLLEKAQQMLLRELVGDPQNGEIRCRLCRILLQKKCKADYDFLLQQIEVLPAIFADKYLFMALAYREKSVLCRNLLDVKGAVYFWSESMENASKLTSLDNKWLLMPEKQIKKAEKLSSKLEKDPADLLNCIRNKEDYEYVSKLADQAAELLAICHSKSSELPKLFWTCLSSGRSDACSLFLQSLTSFNFSTVTFLAFDDEVARKVISVIPPDTQISHVILRHAVVHDDSLTSFLSKFPKLSQLTLDHCPHITNAVVPAKLEVLNVNCCLGMDINEVRCRHLTYRNGLSLKYDNVKLWQNLKTLKLSKSNAVAVDFMQKLAKVSLWHLDIVLADTECLQYLPTSLESLSFTMVGEEVHVLSKEEACFPKMPHLKVFRSNHLQLSEAALRKIAQECHKLVELSVWCNVPDKVMYEVLSKWTPSLKILDLQASTVTAKALPKDMCLEKLNVIGCPNFCSLKPAHLKSIKAFQGQGTDSSVFSSVDALEELVLDGVDFKGAKDWEVLLGACSLTKLSVKRVPDFTDEALCELLSTSPMLRYLELDGLPLLKGNNLSSPMVQLDNVKKLKLASVFSKDSDALNVLLKKMPNLESLALSYSCNLDFQVLALSCPRISKINFTAVDALLEEDNAKWIVKCSTLQKFNVCTAGRLFILTSPHLKHLHWLHSIRHLYVYCDISCYSNIAQCTSLSSLEIYGIIIKTVDMLQSLPLNLLAVLCEQSYADQFAETLARIKSLKAVQIRTTPGFQCYTSPHFTSFARHTSSSSQSLGSSDSDMLKKVLKDAAPKRAKTSKFAFITYFYDAYSMTTLTSLIQHGYTVICGCIDAEVIHDPITTKESLKDLQETDGVRFVDVNMNDLQRLREHISSITDNIDFALIVYPYGDPALNVKAYNTILSSTPFENLLSAEQFSYGIRVQFLSNLLIAAAIHPLMMAAKRPRLLFFATGYSSISSTSAGNRYDVRPGMVCLHSLIKTLSFEYEAVQGMVVGISPGPWAPGLRLTDAIVNRETVSQRIIDTAFGLDPAKYNGKIVSYKLEIVPP